MSVLRADERDEVVRRSRGAARRHVRRRAGPGEGDHRPVGLGQVDAAPLSRTARGARPRRGLARGAAARAPARSGMVFQRFNLFQNMTALENVMCGLVEVQRQPKAEARDAGARVPRPRRGRRQGVAVSRRAVGRPAAARRDRARARDEAEGDALRRADVRARRRARPRGARRDGVARAREDDDGRRHARDALRAERRELGADDGRGPHRRGGAAGRRSSRRRRRSARGGSSRSSSATQATLRPASPHGWSDDVSTTSKSEP